jgi:hypothetical protein
MKEKQTVPEKIIVIDIKLTRGLVVALSCVLVIVALLAYLTLTGESAVASETETAQAASTGMRQFYLTKISYTGDAAKTVCDEGYHMASLWEIADPSNLKYDKSRGHNQTDSGQGPPAGDSIDSIAGWVRTGYVADESYNTGKANCDAWSDWQGNGTLAWLHDDWTSGQHVGIWNVTLDFCDDNHRVWCIED